MLSCIHRFFLIFSLLVAASTTLPALPPILPIPQPIDQALQPTSSAPVVLQPVVPAPVTAPAVYCFHQPWWGVSVDTNICAGTLRLIESRPDYRIVQHHGPHFHDLAWRLPGSECHIFVNATSPTAETDFPYTAVIGKVQSIFTTCRMQRYGGVTLLGTGSRNQFRVSVFGVAGGPANQEPSAYELMLQDAGLDAAADVGELAEVPAAY